MNKNEQKQRHYLDSPPPSSSSSSPPTPPSPLPISVGPGYQKYCFSLSPSPSPTPTPPFSPPLSTHSSIDSFPLLRRDPSDPSLLLPAPAPSTFSLDYQDPNSHDTRTSCLKDLLEWLVLKCCRHCSLWTSPNHAFKILKTETQH
ncbi:hypothetical protein ACH5RR_007812 [Cinchona calisaya]|uniref:Uncharacterized protein n=1 Tax=Cinchona calisaya TaxID=153742 RepID=A0ABD3AD67_9GENT